jgi:hypothetical protein
MHHQRIAAFLLGALILGSLFMIFVATQNFAMADKLGSSEAHAALRDMAGKLNQLFFVNWERAELILGIALLGFLAFGMRRRMPASVAGLIVILVSVQHFLVTPRMIAITQENASGDFARLHATYGIMEVLKLLLAAALAVLQLPSWGRRAAGASQVHAVDYAHHSHVDG